MVRAPCCEKMGLKRGPWTPEEDRILVAFIQSYGHGNWRALPKQAGLLRCGKSCRLRWTNYLRPDIKRGNFTSEEEETIIELHEKLGNRWAAIAGRLPGRTDNEIKNVWHTHLKKRLKKNDTTPETSNNSVEASECEDVTKMLPDPSAESSGDASVSPQPSSSDSSSIDTAENTDIKDDYNESARTTDHDGCNNLPDNFFDIDENFWTDALLGDFSPSASIDHTQPSTFTNSYKIDDSMDFWFDLYIQSGDEQPVLL